MYPRNPLARSMHDPRCARYRPLETLFLFQIGKEKDGIVRPSVNVGSVYVYSVRSWYLDAASCTPVKLVYLTATRWVVTLKSNL